MLKSCQARREHRARAGVTLGSSDLTREAPGAPPGAEQGSSPRASQLCGVRVRSRVQRRGREAGRARGGARGGRMELCLDRRAEGLVVDRWGRKGDQR